MSHLHLVLCTAVLQAAAQHTATKLEVEHAAAPLTVDTSNPRFSWQCSHPGRAQFQTSFRVTLSESPSATTTSAAENVMDAIWDSGTVSSNRTFAVYPDTAPALQSDTDYMWSVVWADAGGVLSQQTNSTFSTAFLATDYWKDADWLTSPNNGSLNLYRAELPSFLSPPTRARLYISSTGYYKATINGRSTDDHLLGPQSTLEVRALYDVWDVTSLIQTAPQGGNTLGVALGNGWGASTHSSSFRTIWDRQFTAILSITASNGTIMKFVTAAASTSAHAVSESSSNAAAGDAAGALDASSAIPLTFASGKGPVTYDDIFDGELYDGRIAAAVTGWDSCNFKPSPSAGAWLPAVKSLISPAEHGATMSSHTLQTVDARNYAAISVQEPFPGVHVFDFGQNMAGQATLKIQNCSAGTVVRMRFGEILWATNKTVHNQFPGGDRPGGMARMLSNYTCAGAEGTTELYRTQFSSFGFRFVQVEGYPSNGTPPSLDTLTAHFIGPDFEPAGRFDSSSALLNGIQQSILASAAANWANDVPTDCPHRERRGYLGDGQHAVETIASNFNAARGYTKWLRDYRDQQAYLNRTLGRTYDPAHPTEGFANGRVGGVAPNGNAQQTDTAWAIAVWNVPAFVAEWYDDDRVLHDMYECCKWSIEHWIAVAASTGGWYSHDMYGDFGNMNTPKDLYRRVKTQSFYITALQKMAQFAGRVGNNADHDRFATMAESVKEDFIDKVYNTSTNCFGNCTYVSQIFGLSLAEHNNSTRDDPVNHRAAWDNVLRSIGPNATNPSNVNRFYGGIVTLKLIYPLLQRFRETTLALKMLLHTDRAPSLGYMRTQGGTTLHEAWDMKAAYAGTWVGSFNHIMLGSPGKWFYTLFAGISQENDDVGDDAVADGVARVGSDGGGMYTAADAEQPSSWSRLRLEPPRNLAFWQDLNSCNGMLETTAGPVIVNWTVAASGNRTRLEALTTVAGEWLYALHAAVPPNSVATLVVPTVAPTASVTITEGGDGVGGGGSIVWSNGQFRSGVKGIQSGVAGADARSVELAVGSGNYSIRVVVSAHFPITE